MAVLFLVMSVPTSCSIDNPQVLVDEALARLGHVWGPSGATKRVLSLCQKVLGVAIIKVTIKIPAPNPSTPCEQQNTLKLHLNSWLCL